MKKLFLFIATLTLSAGLWAQNTEQNTLPTRTITWLVNNSSVKSESKEEGVKLNTLTMPSTPADDALPCSDKFMGWSRENLGAALGQEAPTDLFTDITKLPDTELVGSTDITFYAVFASTGGAAAGTSKIWDVDDIVSGGDYYIGGTVSSKDYFLKQRPSDAAEAYKNGSTNEKGEAEILTFTKSGGNWTIKVGSKYVALNSTNASLTYQTSSTTFKISEDDGLYLENNSRQFTLNASSLNNFGSYATTFTGGADIWLLPAAGYEDYVTSCGKSLSISPKSLTAERPNYGTGTLMATANLYTPTDYTWSSDNESVATVSGSGATVTVTYHSSGLCTITCSAPDGSNPMTATATVTVPAPAPTPISTTYIDENGATQTVDAWEVKSADEQITWGTAGQTTWYVVTGTDVQLTAGAVCQGDVRLILADGAKLTATGFFSNPDRIIYTPGIQVSGDNNSLIIYAQSTDEATMGQLIANGADDAAGIGGGYLEEGSNITINGGIVTANGGKRGAGIGGGFTKCGFNITVNGGIVTANGGNEGAGIGGGGAIALDQSKGYNITINGGIVTANGGNEGAGIGGGAFSTGTNITITGGEVIANGGNQAYTAIGGGYHSQTPASNIKVATTFIIKADGNNPPTTVISNLGLDIANNLKDKRYVTIVNAKIGAIAAINAAIAEGDNNHVKAIATNAIAAINAATSAEIIDALKTQAIDNISSAKAAYAAGDSTGYARGKAEVLGTMGEPCDGCTVVEVTDVTTTVKLYNPTKVSYIKE